MMSHNKFLVTPQWGSIAEGDFSENSNRNPQDSSILHQESASVSSESWDRNKNLLSNCDICNFCRSEILIPGLDGYKCKCGWIGSCRQCKGFARSLLSIGICPACDRANRSAALERKRKRGKGGKAAKKAIAAVGGAS